MNAKDLKHKGAPGSFRDPSGFVFRKDGIIYRQVNLSYKDNYDFLMSSGLYRALVDAGLLISHNEEALAGDGSCADCYKIIRPEQVPFISYPYEWSFSQLKDAALLTLKIQRIALEFGMSLKDCSAYNVQFRRGRPVFIDTLSFEKSGGDKPWVAYRQFCQHFLTPLALMHYKDVRLNQLSRVFIDGIPLDLASSLLPLRSYLRPSLFFHIHLHSRSQHYFSDKSVRAANRRMSTLSVKGMLDNLESAVRNMKGRPGKSQWTGYYCDTNYSADAFEHKKSLVAGYLDKIAPTNVWDLGANVGTFSRLASKKKIPTISFDSDAAAVEKSYVECVKNNEEHILPLVLDLTNPSPGIGWGNQERASLSERGPAHTVFALALIHHLVISHNVPLDFIANFLGSIGAFLVIEFIPKHDSYCRKLLFDREDIFSDYTQENFEHVFKKYFEILDSAQIKDSERFLYLMKKRTGL